MGAVFAFGGMHATFGVAAGLIVVALILEPVTRLEPHQELAKHSIAYRFARTNRS